MPHKVFKGLVNKFSSGSMGYTEESPPRMRGLTPKERVMLRRVHRPPGTAHLLHAEEVLDDVRRVPALGVNAGLDLLDLVQRQNSSGMVAVQCGCSTLIADQTRLPPFG